VPNHVTNIIELYSEEEGLVKRVLEEIKGDDEPDQYIDFAKIVPQPDNLFTDNLSTKNRDECVRKGIPNWYDWQVENWGTKWNAYAQSEPRLEYGTAVLQFDTAWAAPFPVIKALREKYPGLHVYGSWLEEGHQSAGVF